MPDIAGLKLIVPTSVAGSGVSVSASGKVTFTAATSVSVNGCFSASHDNYLIVMRHSSAASTPDINIRYRAAGSDASGSNYAFQYLVASSTTILADRATAQTSGRQLSSASTQRTGHHIYVYGPFLAQPTAGRSVGALGESDARIYDMATTHSLSTSYDGFTLIPATSSLTGALCIYGLSQ